MGLFSSLVKGAIGFATGGLGGLAISAAGSLLGGGKGGSSGSSGGGYTPAAIDPVYADKIKQIISSKPKGSTITIQDLPPAQRNEFYRKAITAMNQGKSMQTVVSEYQSLFPEGYNFSLEGSGFTMPERSVDAMVSAESPGVTKSNAGYAGTDWERVMSSGSTVANMDMGNKAQQARYDALMKIIGNKGGEYKPAQMEAAAAATGMSQEEIDQILAPSREASRQSEAQATHGALGVLSARGFGSSGGAVGNAVGGIATRFANQRGQDTSNLLQQSVQQRFQGALQNQQIQTDTSRYNAGARDAAAQFNIGNKNQAMGQLGEIASQQQAVSLDEKRILLDVLKSGSAEKADQAKLQLSVDALYQDGVQTQFGQEIQQTLAKWQLNMEKYRTDVGVDLAMMENDLKQRIANQTGNIAGAELQARNVVESIKAAGVERAMDDDRNANIAKLELQAAQGDQDAALKMQTLKVEKDLRQQGIDNDWAQYIGTLCYNIQSGKEKLNADQQQFFAELNAQQKAANKKGIFDIVGSVIGSGAKIISALKTQTPKSPTVYK
jgi:hypothetical protein